MDESKGTALWNIDKEAGQTFGVGPGNPNWCERVESGLVAYGSDTDGQTNPFEVRMGKYVGFALVSIAARPDDRVVVQRGAGPVEGTLCDFPFL